MLAPEVMKFLPPKSISLKTSKFHHIQKMIEQLHFSHSITMILPDTLNPPSSIMDIFTNDTSYYKVEGVYMYEFVSPQFIDLFIVNGHLTLHAINVRADLDDNVGINSNGILTLSLKSESFYSSGLEGIKSPHNKNRFVLRYDLLSSTFEPNKKKHLKIAERFAASTFLKFDVVLVWEPKEPSVCPSSIAAWFYEAGYSISTCDPKLERKTFYDVNVPSCEDNELEDLVEWIGMLNLGCDLRPRPGISSYCIPEPYERVGQIVSLQCKGLFPISLLMNALNALQEWSKLKGSSQWCGMVIHGHEDSVTSLGEQEHNYFVEGDYNYSIIIPPEGECRALFHSSSWRKPRIKL